MILSSLVSVRNPGWAGLDEHVNRLLHAEGSAALLDHDDERGWRLLRELSSRKPEYPGLADKLAEASAERVGWAFELGLFARGRKILHDAEPLAPDHLPFRKARDRYIARARELALKAARETGPERLDDLTEALRVWPALEGAGAQYAKAFAAEPTPDVGVADVTPPPGPLAGRREGGATLVPADPGGRRQRGARGEGTGATGRTPLIVRPRTQTEPPPPAGGDLVRRVAPLLRDRRPPALSDRANPESPLYNARWADLLDRIEAPDESRVEIRLMRGLLRPAVWLLDPLGPSHTGPDSTVLVRRGRGGRVGLRVSDGPARSVVNAPEVVAEFIALK